MTALKIAPRKHTPLPAGYVHGYDQASSPPMSREEEVAAFEALRQGDESQRERIFAATVRFAIQQAGKFQGRGLEMVDLVQDAIAGLLHAIDRYEPERGFRFISYAVHWIKQSLFAAAAETTVVRLPLNTCRDRRRVFEYCQERGAVDGRHVPPREAAEALGVPIDLLVEVQSLDSLRAGYDPDSDASLGHNASPDTLDRLAVSPDEDSEGAELRARVARLLDVWWLDGRARYIIERYYGLDGQPSQTLEQIGALVGLTRERVRQIRDATLLRFEAQINGRRAEMLEMVEG